METLESETQRRLGTREDMGRGAPDTPWTPWPGARPSDAHVNRQEPEAKACDVSKPPTQPPSHTPRGEKTNLLGR
jgi:hypothetical protein